MLPLNGGGQVMVAWVDNSTTAILAWRAADNATEAMTASNVEMSATSFLGSVFANASVNSAALNPFQQALQGSPGSTEDLASVCGASLLAFSAQPPPPCHLLHYQETPSRKSQPHTCHCSMSWPKAGAAVNKSRQ